MQPGWSVTRRRVGRNCAPSLANRVRRRAARHVAAGGGKPARRRRGCSIERTNPVQLAYARRRIQGSAAITGDADRAMNFARMFMPLVGWNRSLVEEFLALSDPPEQLDFWRERLDTRRFRAGFDLLLSRPLLRLVYAPQFLSFLPLGFGTIMRERWERCFALHPNAANPYARLLLLGDANALTANSSGQAPGQIEFVEGDAAGYLESCEAGCFEGRGDRLGYCRTSQDTGNQGHPPSGLRCGP